MKIIFKPEPAYLMAYNLNQNKALAIAGNHLIDLNQWLITGENNEFVQSLMENGFINMDFTDQDKEELQQQIILCREIKAPLRSLHSPEIMNIELTTRCPLRCPQCYCDLHQGKDIKKEIALKYLEQAADLRIPFINLSGGETLAYPHLTELLEFTGAHGLHAAIAISGWGFDHAKLQELKRAGVGEIYVSLNGSSQEINALSRDGYDMAVNALRLLQEDQGVDYYINWVARNDNIEDFPNLVSMAQNYGVKGIVVLESKPDASYVVQATLSEDNFLMLANFIKNHNQQAICIAVEPCFSPLRAYIYNAYLWNRNTGVNKGCGAGRNAMAVDVDGNLIPCRHLLYPEPYEQIEDYWQHSEVLKQLREYEDHKEEPCRNCYLTNNCISCRAVADKVEKNVYSGNHYCTIGGREK